MKEVTFVTRNLGKVATLSTALSSAGIAVVHYEATLDELQNNLTGPIALRKACDGYRLTGKPTVALDAGFWIDHLNGFPGPYIEYVLRKLGIAGILSLGKGRPVPCHFVESLAYFDGISEPVLFEEHIPGLLGIRPQGTLRPEHWSALSTVFMPMGFNKTIAQMSVEGTADWRASREGSSHVCQFTRWTIQN